MCLILTTTIKKYYSSDVTEAARLVRVALQEAAMDPRTGTIDMDLISTGRSASTRSRLSQLAAEIKYNLFSFFNSSRC